MGVSIEFDGLNTATYGLVITEAKLNETPARDITEIEIPGRNGNLIQDNGRYKNTVISFTVGGEGAKIEEFAADVASRRGYKRFTDSTHLLTFREACLVGSVIPEMMNPHQGTAEFEFTAKPQKFLLSGESATRFDANGTITNPTAFPSKPLIYVLTTDDAASNVAEVTINGKTFSLTKTTAQAWGYYVDCESMNVYNGNINRNVRFSGEFPELLPGENTVEFNEFVQYIMITPRWYTI